MQQRGLPAATLRVAAPLRTVGRTSQVPEQHYTICSSSSSSSRNYGGSPPLVVLVPAPLVLGALCQQPKRAQRRSAALQSRVIARATPLQEQVAVASKDTAEDAEAKQPETVALPETYVPPDQDGSPGLYLSSEPSFVRTAISQSLLASTWDYWYKAPWWLSQGDAMTIYAAKFREADKVKYDRRLVETIDGGVLALDVVLKAAGNAATPPSPDRPFALLVSGLGGGSQDGYVKNMASALVSGGWSVGVLNMRGCGKSPVRTPRLFSAYRGSTDDVRMGIRYVRDNLGARDVVLVGWSNGATIVANTLAEQTLGTGKGHKPGSSGAVAGAILAAPYDMPRSTENLEGHPFARMVYNRLVTSSLVRQFEPHMHHFENGPIPRWSDDALTIDVDVDLLMGASTIRDIDEAITRKVFGYDSVDDYYYNSSSIRRLDHVQVPLLMVSAADDPMSTGWIPTEQVRRNPNLVLAYTAHGGHLGWQDEQNSARCHWVQEVVREFLTATVQKTAKA